ncbi:hypothetical protein ACFWXB_13940 [Tsukamurella tyrosinosolvens]|uniref:hypothetical protein n=1 Tax=Tsukamurella tyrosinosolvens TaxID=57704 RepID=UPI002DD41E91|nr:hypothetical protein [Tsukamurella tyrosinosolvens]MEC4612868.1 hypothetical protein [Tsukamurella tyrosinosolvens]
MAAYTPVQSTIDAAASDAQFHAQVRELAEDCINQGGISNLHVILPVPEEPEPSAEPQ